MRLWTWMLCVVLAAGLTACSPNSDPGTPGDGEVPKNGPDSESPPLDPTSVEPVVKPNTDGGQEEEPPKTTIVASPQSEFLAQLADPATRDTTVAEIRERGSDMVPELVTALDDPDWRVRAGAAFGLSVLGKEAQQALPKLRSLAESDQHESARDAATWAIDAIAESN